jgi:hypothetical protein
MNSARHLVGARKATVVRVLSFLPAVVLVRLLCLSAAYAQYGLWTNRYDGGYGADRASGIGFDKSGNVFVCGTSLGSNGNYCAVTIKYSGAGLPLWTNRYDPGAGVDVEQYYDFGPFNVDTNGDVRVGVCLEDANLPYFDHVMVKYSNEGVPQATNRIHLTPFDTSDVKLFALDANENLVVAGTSADTNGEGDYLTIKYSKAGSPVWTNRYDGPVNEYDYAEAIAMDARGNVVVTGVSEGTITYPVWFGEDFLTIKYSSDGVPLWTNRYDGPAGKEDFAYHAVVDNNDDVFVTGSSDGANPFQTREYATIKYSSDGVPLWISRYNGQGGGGTSFYITLDSAGNVIVLGNVSFPGSLFSMAMVKYSSEGVPLWTNVFTGAPNSVYAERLMAVDAHNNLFVAGETVSASDGRSSILTIVCSSEGVLVRTNLYHGPHAGDDYPRAVGIDQIGNLYVAGSTVGADGHDDLVVIKYSSLLAESILLDFQFVNNQLVLSWDDPAYALQSSPTIDGAFIAVNGATSPYTNQISAGQQFFRLKSNR